MLSSAVQGIGGKIVDGLKGATTAAVDFESSLVGISKVARGTDDTAEGFARKNGIAHADLSIVETPKGRYLRAVKRTPGAEVSALLPEVLAAVSLPPTRMYAVPGTHTIPRGSAAAVGAAITEVLRGIIARGLGLR